MDRRRFVPSTEGLEGRALLSGLFGKTTNANTSNSQDIPATFLEKEHRVERLPYYLEKIKSGRYLPAATIDQLQADLLAVAGNLHAPVTGVLDAYNSELRNVSSSNSLSIPDAHALNNVFSKAVAATGATPQQVASLSNDMNALARVDANSPQPVFLATNDYTLVLQTVLGIGRAIRRPSAPQLAAHNGTRVAAVVGVTPKSQPVMVGNYDAFATVQILDGHGNVYGTAAVQRNGPTDVGGVAQATGKYAVQFNKPLADGTYLFYLRAVDSQGHVSHLSRAFQLKVITRPITQANAHAAVPGGPLAVNKR
jgi:hypothetical protein